MWLAPAAGLKAVSSLSLCYQAKILHIETAFSAWVPSWASQHGTKPQPTHSGHAAWELNSAVERHWDLGLVCNHRIASSTLTDAPASWHLSQSGLMKPWLGNLITENQENSSFWVMVTYNSRDCCVFLDGGGMEARVIWRRRRSGDGEERERSPRSWGCPAALEANLRLSPYSALAVLLSLHSLILPGNMPSFFQASLSWFLSLAIGTLPYLFSFHRGEAGAQKKGGTSPGSQHPLRQCLDSTWWSPRHYPPYSTRGQAGGAQVEAWA